MLTDYIVFESGKGVFIEDLNVLYDPEPEWTAADEQLLNEHWEMVVEHQMDIEWAWQSNAHLIHVSDEAWDRFMRLLDED